MRRCGRVAGDDIFRRLDSASLCEGIDCPCAILTGFDGRLMVVAHVVCFSMSWVENCHPWSSARLRGPRESVLPS